MRGQMCWVGRRFSAEVGEGEWRMRSFGLGGGWEFATESMEKKGQAISTWRLA